MTKTATYLVAALFVASSVSAFAGKHMASEQEKKPTAEECKKDPKTKGCDDATKSTTKK